MTKAQAAFRHISKIIGIKEQADGRLVRPDDIFPHVNVVDFVIGLDRAICEGSSPSDMAALIDKGLEMYRKALDEYGLKVMSLHTDTNPAPDEPHISITIKHDKNLQFIIDNLRA